jgi:hypothetical protein
MRRAVIIVGLVALLSIALLALATSAQTNPPASGDWVISDSTTISNRGVSITGAVRVMGSGHLTLNNVDLRFTGTSAHEILVTTNARLTISGGTVTTTSGTYSVSLQGRSKIDGCAFANSRGIYSSTWRTEITNCSIINPSGTGIQVSPPINSYPTGAANPLKIRDNNITGAAQYGINIDVPNSGDNDVRVLLRNNSVTGALQDGIHVSANTDKGRFLMEENKVWLSANDGIDATLDVRVVEIRLDRVYAKNNTGDGVFAQIACSIHHMKFLDDVTSIGNGGEGVEIRFTQTHWYRPEFKRWYIDDNVGGGINFVNFNCATISDSYNKNDQSQADYTVQNTVLWVFRTTHRKAQARVTGDAYHVASFRYLNLHVTWQNGNPCRYNTVEFEDGAGERLWAWTSNYDGWLGNHTQWDWRVTSTRSHIRQQLSTFMIGGQQRLPGPSIDFNRDFKENLVFNDNQPPDLSVLTPTANHVQSTENLSIEGTCVDAHSGAQLVQVSFDPEAVWGKKAWYNATGTSSWEKHFDPWPDGIYTVFVRAFDSANYPGGVFANITITNVSLDTSAPNLTIINPPADRITNQSQITILGTTDPDVVTLTINGEFLEFFGGTFNKALQLNEGKNSLVIVATDFAGNLMKATRNITLDSVPPILVISSPKDGLRTNMQTLTLGGFTDIEGVDIWVDSVPVQISSGTWTHTVTLLRGTNTILVDAVDIAENHRVINLVVIYDPDPPVINVNSPAPGEIINSSIFELLGLTDPDIKHNQISVNGIFIGVSNGVFQHEMTVVEEGALNITIVAVDLAGNEATKIIPIFIDTTPPDIWDISLLDGDILNTPTLAITGYTEEDARLFVEGNVIALVEGYFSTTVGLDEGENEIVFRVTDTAGNTQSIIRTVTLDTLPPNVFLDEIVGNITRTKDRFITLRGNVEGASRITVTYGEVSEEVFVSSAGEFQHPVIIGKNKSTFVTLTTTDYAGNVNKISLTVKKIEEEEPGLFEKSPEIMWGLIILVVVIFVAYPITQYGLSMEYKRRIKRMGYSVDGPQGTTAPPAGQPRPPTRPPGPPGQAPAPPRPPAPGEGQAPPRPPRADEEAPKAPPRPPMDGE